VDYHAAIGGKAPVAPLAYAPTVLDTFVESIGIATHEEVAFVERRLLLLLHVLCMRCTVVRQSHMSSPACRSIPSYTVYILSLVINYDDVSDDQSRKGHTRRIGAGRGAARWQGGLSYGWLVSGDNGLV